MIRPAAGKPWNGGSGTVALDVLPGRGGGFREGGA